MPADTGIATVQRFQGRVPNGKCFYAATSATDPLTLLTVEKTSEVAVDWVTVVYDGNAAGKVPLTLSVVTKAGVVVPVAQFALSPTEQAIVIGGDRVLHLAAEWGLRLSGGTTAGLSVVVSGIEGRMPQ